MLWPEHRRSGYEGTGSFQLSALDAADKHNENGYRKFSTGVRFLLHRDPGTFIDILIEGDAPTTFRANYDAFQVGQLGTTHSAVAGSVLTGGGRPVAVLVYTSTLRAVRC